MKEHQYQIGSLYDHLDIGEVYECSTNNNKGFIRHCLHGHKSWGGRRDSEPIISHFLYHILEGDDMIIFPVCVYCFYFS